MSLMPYVSNYPVEASSSISSPQLVICTYCRDVRTPLQSPGVAMLRLFGGILCIGPHVVNFLYSGTKQSGRLLCMVVRIDDLTSNRQLIRVHLNSSCLSASGENPHHAPQVGSRWDLLDTSMEGIQILTHFTKK